MDTFYLTLFSPNLDVGGSKRTRTNKMSNIKLKIMELPFIPVYIGNKIIEKMSLLTCRNVEVSLDFTNYPLKSLSQEPF